MALVGVKYEQLAVSSTAVAFVTTDVQNVKPMGAEVRVNTAPIRYRTDGTDPTASVGIYANVGDLLFLMSRIEVRRFKAIRATGADASLDVNLQV